MQKNNGLKKPGFSIGTATKEYFNIIKNTDKRVFSLVVALVIILSGFGIITKHYTVAYDVYYGDVNVGVTTSKEVAMESYSEAETIVEECNLGNLEHDLKFVMTISPISTVTESNIYRGIIEAAEGSESCYSIKVKGETITKVKTKEDAKKAIELYLARFEDKNADTFVSYSIVPDNDIVTEIKSVESAVKEITTSGKLVVSYEEVLEKDVTIYYKENYIENPELPKGLTVVNQEGVNGKGVKKITYYEDGLTVKSAGPVVETLEEAVDAIYYIGTAEFSGIEEKSLPWPTDGIFTSEYGSRWGRHHNGIDIAASKGTPIYAPCNGVVTFSGKRNGYGNFVTIDHGEGYTTTYAHMNKIHVKEGAIVKVGDLIGEVGTTGRVTGAHLHFEVLLNGDFVDPMIYIKN